MKKGSLAHLVYISRASGDLRNLMQPTVNLSQDYKGSVPCVRNDEVEIVVAGRVIVLLARERGNGVQRLNDIPLG